MLDGIRAEGAASYTTFTDAGELSELIAGDLATVLAERFGGASAAASRRSSRRPLRRWSAATLTWKK